MPSALSLRANVLLRGEETDGLLSMTEIVVPPHTAGPRCTRTTSTRPSTWLRAS
jgi:hypothetical protein